MRFEGKWNSLKEVRIVKTGNYDRMRVAIGVDFTAIFWKVSKQVIQQQDDLQGYLSSSRKKWLIAD